jgi:hypothetical protein
VNTKMFSLSLSLSLSLSIVLWPLLKNESSVEEDAFWEEVEVLIKQEENMKYRIY